MAADQPVKPQRRRSLLLYLTLGWCLVLVLATLATYGARLHWLLELFCHFHLQYAIATCPALASLLLLKRWRLALIPAALLVYFLCILSPAMPSFQATTSSEVSHRMVMANVLTSNPHKEKVRAMLREANPDFFILLETNQAWSDALEDLDAPYPHTYRVPRNDNFGMLFYSRLPVVSIKKHLVGEALLPMVVAKLECRGVNLTVIAAHPLPPVSSWNARERLIYLNTIEELAGKAEGPVMVAGDLNITSGSPYFYDLLAGGKLRDTRRGFGPQPSWPGFIWPLRMCIDHVLVSENVQIYDRKLAAGIGSDHMPVVVDFAVTDRH